VDEPDVGVIIFSLDPTDVEAWAGEKPRQATVMEKAVEVALG
jgi:hypothetical protein